MKVLHCIAGKMYGGVEVFLKTLAETVPGDITQEFASFYEGKIVHQLRQIGASVHDLGSARLSLPWTVWRAHRRVERLHKERDYDLMICHGTWVWATLGKAFGDRPTSLVWLHDGYHSQHRIEKRAVKYFPRHFVANSEYVRSTILPFAHSQSIECSVVACAVQKPKAKPDARARIRRELGVSEQTPVIVQVSRYEPYKGLHNSIEALSRLNRKDVELWILGEAQRKKEKAYANELAKLCQEYHLSDQVRFLGQQKNVGDYLAASDIFCQPNDLPEPFGIVFVEALYHCLPVVATALGGAKEILTPECARLVKPNSVDALSEALKTLVENPSLRKQLGSQGPERATLVSHPDSFWNSFRNLPVHSIGSSNQKSKAS